MMSSLNIGGFTPLTTIDYPNKLSCVVFCQGCAWRCGYCHNPELIKNHRTSERSWQDVYAFLLRRRGLLDAVVFSGGEATLQPHLIPAMTDAKALGFLLGLHSAGIHPSRFARALALADWVGFDVKALPEDSRRITNVRGSGEVNWRSLALLLDSGVAYECRTTVHWQLLDVDAVWRLAQRLHQGGVTHYAIQLARPARMLDDTLTTMNEPSEAAALWQALRALFPHFNLRGHRDEALCLR